MIKTFSENYSDIFQILYQFYHFIMTHLQCCLPCCEHRQQTPAASRFLHGDPCESCGGSVGSEDFWWLRWQTHCPVCQLPTLRWRLLAPWCLWCTEKPKVIMAHADILGVNCSENSNFGLCSLVTLSWFKVFGQ